MCLQWSSVYSWKYLREKYQAFCEFWPILENYNLGIHFQDDNIVAIICMLIKSWKEVNIKTSVPQKFWTIHVQ